MSETRVTAMMSKTQAGILIALAKKEAARARAGLDDAGRPLTEADREALERYHSNVKAALAALQGAA